MDSKTQTDDSDGAATPQQRFASAIDDFLSELSKEDAKNPFVQAIIECRQQIESGGSFETQKESTKLHIFVSNFVHEAAANKKQSKTYRFLDKLDPFVASLTGITKFCESAFQASPLAVAAIFAGVRVLLEQSQKVQESFVTVMEALEEIDLYLHCYDNFLDAYPEDTRMQTKLVASYRKILQFWLEATKLLFGSILRNLTRQMFGKLDKALKEQLATIKGDRDNIQCLAQAIEAKLNSSSRQDIVRDRLLPWIAGTDDPKIRSKLNPRDNLYNTVDLHHDGTCTWIFDHPGYKSWDEPTIWTGPKADPVLWYNAPPGCGKTILASQLVSHFQKEKRKVFWFFCSFDDPIRKTPMGVFRSLAIQLLCRNVSKRVPEKIVDMYRDDEADFSPCITHPTPLLKVVHELLKAMSIAYIVVDGLDEIVTLDNASPSFLNMFEQLILLAPERPGTVKWCFTSRNEGPIAATMARLKAIPVVPPPQDMDADIKAYLEARLAARLAKNELSPTDIDDLVKVADGNFLVARMHSATLMKGLSKEEEQEEMKALAKDVSGCYMRSLEKLNQRSPNEQELARRTILILVSAMKLLTMAELLDALGTRIGSADFSSDRIPSEELIHQLCGPFLMLDSSSADTAQNPIVKLCHKSVQDFFLQGGDSGIPDHLEKYFINPILAGREMGQICLTYLRFKRYELPKGLPDSFETDNEHAFLRYAAVFWFQHMGEFGGVACTDLRQDVRDFLQSGAFWTAVRVQTKVARYLFARYMRIGTGGFRMDAEGSEWSASDFVASTIPFWLEKDDDGKVSKHDMQLIHHFQRFIMEWQEALSSGTDSLLSCPMDPAAAEYFPKKSAFQEKGIKRVALGCRAQRQSDHVAIDEVSFEKRVFKARVLCTKASGVDPFPTDWLITAPFANPKKVPDIHGSFKSSVESQFFYTGSLGVFPGTPLGLYSIVKNTLKVTVATGHGQQSYPPPQRLAHQINSSTPHGWQLLTELRDPSRFMGSASVVCHFTRVNKYLGTTLRLLENDISQDDRSSSEEETEAEYDEEEEEDDEEKEYDEEEEESGSDTGSETDDESGHSDISTDATESALDTFSDMLVIVRHVGDPIWIPCQGSHIAGRQIRGALHPTAPIFVWAQDTRKLDIMNTADGKMITCDLPEPHQHDEDSPTLPQVTYNIAKEILAESERREDPSFRARFGPRLMTELHFSADGSTLHVLSVTFEAQGRYMTKATVSLASFGFQATSGETGAEKPSLERIGCDLSVTYLFLRRIDHLTSALGTAYWDSDAVYICVPLLACSVKFIKMRLDHSASESSQASPSMPEIQTLARTVCIPSSTSQRRPRLLYQSNPSKDEDSLYLALDPEPKLATPTDVEDRYYRGKLCSMDDKDNDLNQQEEFGRAGASVIRWCVPRDGGWRDWDVEKDSLSEVLRRKPTLGSIDLRGSFIDADKMFDVPIRGALNFQWRGYLSCG